MLVEIGCLVLEPGHVGRGDHVNEGVTVDETRLGIHRTDRIYAGNGGLAQPALQLGRAMDGERSKHSDFSTGPREKTDLVYRCIESKTARTIVAVSAVDKQASECAAVCGEPLHERFDERVQIFGIAVMEEVPDDGDILFLS